MKIRKYISLIFVLMLLLLANLSNAKMALVTFEEKVKLSELIILCEALEIKENFWSQNVVLVNPKRIIKGMAERHKITIKYGKSFFKEKSHKDKFVTNRSYVLFLFKENSFYQILGGFQGYFPVQNDGLVYDLEDEKIQIDAFIKKIENVDVDKSNNTD